MTRKRWIMLIISAGVVGLIVFAMRPKPMVVQSVMPKVQTIKAYVQEQAVTELPHDYLISMPINGWLNPITLREGDTVTADQVVATMQTGDLKDRLIQATQRIAVLEVQIAEAKDHRLDENARVEMDATVKAIDETVKAATARLDATHAVLDYAREQVDRLRELAANDASTDRERRLAQLEYRKTNSDYQVMPWR